MTGNALQTFVDALPDEGDFSIWCGPVSGPPRLSHRAHDEHYAASTMKLALVIAAYRAAETGRIHLDMPVTVHESFSSAVGGTRFSMDRDDDSDPDPWRRLGEQVSLRWLCYRAIVRSSNLATNLVLEVVGTHAVGQTLAAIGTTGSIVTRGIEDTAAQDAGLHNRVTAADLARTLQTLDAAECAQLDSCREILAVLAAQQVNDAIPGGLPAGTRVAHKSGWVNGVSHDAGIVSPGDADPFVFVMCTTSRLDEQRGLELIAAGAAAAWTDRRVLG